MLKSTRYARIAKRLAFALFVLAFAGVSACGDGGPSLFEGPCRATIDKIQECSGEIGSAELVQGFIDLCVAEIARQAEEAGESLSQAQSVSLTECIENVSCAGGEPVQAEFDACEPF